MVLGNWISAYQRLNLDPYISSCTKLKSKQIKDLNVNKKNLLEDKICTIHEHISIGKDFLNRTPTIQDIVPKTKKWIVSNLNTSA